MKCFSAPFDAWSLIGRHRKSACAAGCRASAFGRRSGAMRRELGLAGEVLNDAEGVLIRVGGTPTRDRAP